MLFTWNTKNLCIVFRQWHVTSTASLIVSLLLVVAIGVGYEALREGIRRYEVSVNKRADTAPRKYISSGVASLASIATPPFPPFLREREQKPLRSAPESRSYLPPCTCESSAKIESAVVERPKLLLSQPPSSGQDKIESRSRAGPISSSRFCTDSRTSMPSWSCKLTRFLLLRSLLSLWGSRGYTERRERLTGASPPLSKGLSL